MRPLFSRRTIRQWLKGEPHGYEEVPVGVVGWVLVYVILVVMIVLQAIITILAHIPIGSQLLETGCRLYGRGGLGCFLRSAYFRTRLGHIGKDVLIDVGVTIVAPWSVSIDDDARIDAYVSILGSRKAQVHIGRWTYIASHCVINGAAGVYIGDAVAVGEGSMITSVAQVPGEASETLKSLSPQAPPGMVELVEKPVVLADLSSVGHHCTVFPGAVLAYGALVGPQSYVEQYIPFCAFALGSPAVVLGHRPTLLLPANRGTMTSEPSSLP